MTFNEIRHEVNKYNKNETNSLDIDEIVDMIYEWHYNYVEDAYNHRKQPDFNNTYLKEMIEILDLQIIEENINNDNEVSIDLHKILTTDKQRNKIIRATNYNDSVDCQYSHWTTTVKPSARNKNANTSITNALKTLEKHDSPEWNCLMLNGIQSTGVAKKENVRPARIREQIDKALITLETHNTREFRCLEYHGFIDDGFSDIVEELEDDFEDFGISPEPKKNDPTLLSNNKRYITNPMYSDLNKEYWKEVELYLIKEGVSQKNARLIYNYYK